MITEWITRFLLGRTNSNFHRGFFSWSNNLRYDVFYYSKNIFTRILSENLNSTLFKHFENFEIIRDSKRI